MVNFQDSMYHLGRHSEIVSRVEESGKRITPQMRRDRRMRGEQVEEDLIARGHLAADIVHKIFERSRPR